MHYLHNVHVMEGRQLSSSQQLLTSAPQKTLDYLLVTHSRPELTHRKYASRTGSRPDAVLPTDRSELPRSPNVSLLADCCELVPLEASEVLS